MAILTKLQIPEEWKLSVTVTGITLAIAYWLWSRQHRQHGFPNGPFSFPILGNLPQTYISGSMDSFIASCRKKYGDVFTVEFGGSRRVVVCGYDNIHQLLVKNADLTSNRSTAAFPPDSAEAASKAPGLVWAQFPHWKTWRNFSLNFMREGGMGKQAMESKISIEADKFCQHYIEPEIGNPIELSVPIGKATCNIISELVFGGRREYDDEYFSQLIDSVQKRFKTVLKAGMLKNVPFIKYFKSSGSADAKAHVDNVRLYMSEQIEHHRSTLDPDNPRDIIDMYLIGQGVEETDDFVYSDTTSSAIRWALTYTCQNPDVKKRVQKEIDDNLGQEREAVYGDRNILPYTDAVLLEVLRHANIAPTALPHSLDKPIVINGQMIPGGADLLLSMTSVLHDENIFEEPLKFNPDRYISGDTTLLKQRTIPFSLGRRNCLGESLARAELFMFYVTLMQRYDVNILHEDMKLSSPITVLVKAPPPYRIKFTHRKPMPGD